ncbi:MAG: hypothetical protein F7C81_01970 [Desulfurococcales archaeon]|nr:hypothetical protein [Desulfurococcales archaeon]
MTITALESELYTANMILKSVWSDMYFSNYEWVVEKAYQAARVALQAYLKSRGFTPTHDSPVSMHALVSSTICPDIRGESRDIIWLESFRELIFNQDLRILLSPDTLQTSRAEALRSIEASVKINSIIKSCWHMEGEPVSMLMKAYKDLNEYANLVDASVLRIGDKVIIASNRYNDLKPKERIEVESGNIPLGFTPILVTPDEAYALVNLPWFKGYTDLEILVDNLGIFRLLL